MQTTTSIQAQWQMRRLPMVTQRRPGCRHLSQSRERLCSRYMRMGRLSSGALPHCLIRKFFRNSLRTGPSSAALVMQSILGLAAGRAPASLTRTGSRWAMLPLEDDPLGDDAIIRTPEVGNAVLEGHTEEVPDCCILSGWVSHRKRRFRSIHLDLGYRNT